MSAQPVEWILVVKYLRATHQAIYGRQVKRGGYTKDYIQLSRKESFVSEAASVFSVAENANEVPLTFKWPEGSANGAFVLVSADRPHLKWATRDGAPRAWKMALHPSESTQETIPGDPSHSTFEEAEKEFELLTSRGAGQPYLMAIKLRDEARTLHLRVFLDHTDMDFSWADLDLVPEEVRELTARTSKQLATAWSLVQSGGIVPTTIVQDALTRISSSSNWKEELDTIDVDTGRALSAYLRAPGHGLFFDPTLNHDAWIKAEPLHPAILPLVDSLLESLERKFPCPTIDDAAAEALEFDSDEVEALRKQSALRNYEVSDSHATVKTRGSAQKVFSDAVKSNYEYCCAITGICTKDFLVAAHIVPWSLDKTIRLDPSNGICLSLLVDKAFEKGYLQILDDLTIHVDQDRINGDEELLNQLAPYDGKTLGKCVKEAPQPEYLRRRRALLSKD